MPFLPAVSSRLAIEQLSGSSPGIKLLILLSTQGLCLYIAANGSLRILQQFSMRVPSIRAMAGLPERNLPIQHSPSFRDTINKYKKEFADRWESEKERAVAFETTRTRNSSTDSLRKSFARSPIGGATARKAGAPRPYKRPIVVYEDEVSSVVKKEKALVGSRRGGPVFEPEQKSKGKRANA